MILVFESHFNECHFWSRNQIFCFFAWDTLYNSNHFVEFLKAIPTLLLQDWKTSVEKIPGLKRSIVYAIERPCRLKIELRPQITPKLFRTINQTTVFISTVCCNASLFYWVFESSNGKNISLKFMADDHCRRICVIFYFF